MACPPEKRTDARSIDGAPGFSTNSTIFCIQIAETHDAHDTDDLYTTLGYTLANETAKAVNKRDIPHLLEATECISKHSSMQADSLLKVYAYLGEINSLHSQLKLQKRDYSCRTTCT